LLLLLAGCGVNEGLYNARVNELSKCKTDLDSANREKAEREAALITERSGLRGELARKDKERTALAYQVSALQGETGTLSKTVEELRHARELAEKRSKTYRDLAQKLRSMVEAGKLEVSIRKGRMVVKLADQILFDAGRTELKPEGKAALTEVANALRTIPDRDFLIAGHTDIDPIRGRKFRSNWDLSAARAVEVVAFLQQGGVDPARLAASGFAEYDPVADNGNAEGKAQNRRIEVIVMPNIEELPPIEDPAVATEAPAAPSNP
jgi:chemotaxis protein MotB